MSSTSAAGNLARFNFELFGKVQGVWFRKHTVEHATKLGLVGWVANTDEGTVAGECQGPAANLETMQHWLEHVGSPASEVVKAVFSDMEPIHAPDYTDFAARPS